MKMPIIKRIATIATLIALHHCPVAWADGEYASLPAVLTQQTVSTPLQDQPSEGLNQNAPSLLNDNEQSSPTDTSSNPDTSGPGPGFADRLHSEISRRLLTTAVWLDSFFEDQRVTREENRSYIRARYDVFQEDRSGATYRPTFNIRLALPQLERKTHFVISAESPEPATNIPVQAGTVINQAGTASDRISPTDERNVTTSVHYIIRSTEEESTIVRTGAQFSHGSPVLFIAPRYRHFIPLTNWDFRMTQEAVYKTDTKWQMDTLFDLERQLPRGLFFRTSVGGSWIDGTKGYFYSLSFSLRQLIDPMHALDYTWINSYQTRPVYELAEILFSIRYRQRVLRDWFFVEVAPQIRYPRSGNFDGLPGILFRFEVYFGRNE
jgi:hypothetical protein